MNSWEETDAQAAADRSADGAQAAGPDGLSGRSVVLLMFGFGILATGVLWLYWELHTRPFRPLQEAIVRTFPGSNPRVQGGQAKIHKGTPRILQIVMRVDFDPVLEDEKAQRIAQQVAALARQHQDMSRYEQLEIGLFRPLAEHEPRMRTIRILTRDESPVANSGS